MLYFSYSSAGDGGLYEPAGAVSDIDVVDLFSRLKLNVSHLHDRADDRGLHGAVEELYRPIRAGNGSELRGGFCLPFPCDLESPFFAWR